MIEALGLLHQARLFLLAQCAWFIAYVPLTQTEATYVRGGLDYVSRQAVVFDSMRSYAVRNGYDRFIEQKHFENPIFTTIWGVCDEDLFNRTLQECAELSKAGRPFFATALTVSNHKPYMYPKGRIPEDPEARSRDHAVKYSDYALGAFFRAAPGLRHLDSLHDAAVVFRREKPVSGNQHAMADRGWTDQT